MSEGRGAINRSLRDSPLAYLNMKESNESCPAGGTDIPVCHLMSELELHSRQLPHWVLEGAVYYITFRLLVGKLSREEIDIVLSHIRSGNEKFYTLLAAVVLPDHVHLILQPKDGYSLSRVMKGIKGVSARLLNLSRGSKGIIWLDESWDRIIRDEKEFREKLKYMFENPYKARLAEEHENYSGWFLGEW